MCLESCVYDAVSKRNVEMHSSALSWDNQRLLNSLFPKTFCKLWGDGCTRTCTVCIHARVRAHTHIHTCTQTLTHTTEATAPRWLAHKPASPAGQRNVSNGVRKVLKNLCVNIHMYIYILPWIILVHTLEFFIVYIEIQFAVLEYVLAASHKINYTFFFARFVY